jgi:hypothetical protein
MSRHIGARYHRNLAIKECRQLELSKDNANW